MMIRSELCWEAGGLDEDFFAHMEEIDLCWRVNRLGNELWVMPESTVFHLGGGTLNETNARKTYLNFRNSLYNLTKNLPLKRLIPILLIRFVLDQLAALRFMISGQWSHAFKVYQANIDFIRHCRSMYLKRQSTPIDGHQFVYKQSVIWQRYIKGRKKFSDLKIPNGMSFSQKSLHIHPKSKGQI
jgi:hypothetical protein